MQHVQHLEHPKDVMITPIPDPDLDTSASLPHSGNRVQH